MKSQIILRLKEEPSLPVEGNSINPENFLGKSLQEIYSLPLLYGNQQKRLEDFFEVDTVSDRVHSPQEEGPVKIILEGDLTRFKGIGQGMAAGEMEVHGPVGFHAGAMMSGGSLIIRGNAGDFLGAHMKGGQITVTGSAGHFAGGSYRGETAGMTGGVILIKGNAGQMAGTRMRRGLIAIGGNSGDAPGFKMLAGTVLIAGQAGIRTGANMIRGTIILLKDTCLLPTFYYNCQYRPVFWGLLYQDLAKKGFLLPHICQDALFKRFSGDAITGGRGEVLICQSF